MLMAISKLLASSESGDYERYVKMALKIDPLNPVFLERKVSD